MARKIFQLRVFRARNFYECNLCQAPIEKGQYYYRDDPHPQARRHRGQTVRYYCVHCVDSDAVWEQEQLAEEARIRSDRNMPVRVELIDVSAQILAQLRLDPDELFRISPEQLEILVCDRLGVMGFQAERVGKMNRKDGGIDIVFWSKSHIPVLGAAQVKHHRSHEHSTGPGDVRDFRGALAAGPFQCGVIVTNTTFTPDARWFADNQQGLIRLRDGEDLRRWIDGKFITNEDWRALPGKLVLCPGIEVDVPKFR